jgi:hypothetical protein
VNLAPADVRKGAAFDLPIALGARRRKALSAHVSDVWCWASCRSWHSSGEASSDRGRARRNSAGRAPAALECRRPPASTVEHLAVSSLGEAVRRSTPVAFADRASAAPAACIGARLADAGLLAARALEIAVPGHNTPSSAAAEKP